MREDVLTQFDYDFDQITYEPTNMNNRLFCTFSTKDELDGILDAIESGYQIIYNKIFVLHAVNQEEFVCTYNVDFGNVSSFLPNTILVHRKKASNTLYTINALNTLIKSLNNGQLDSSFQINWDNYRNCILLTKGSELRKLDTKLHKIVEL